MIKSALQSSLTNDIKYRSMSAGAVPSSEYLIQTFEVGATPLTEVVFSNLGEFAGVYRHLQIVAVSRVASATTLRMMRLRLNGDTAGNYNSHQILGDSNAGTPYNSSEVNGSGLITYYQNGASNPSGAFGAGVVEILDAYSTTKFKTIKSIGGQHGYSIVNLSSGAWRNTAAINSITVFSENSDSFAQFSRFSLYGVTA